MMKLSKKSLLAIETVLDIATHARPDPVQARAITARQNVPQRYLEQVMQALVHANILRGVRGPRGGYRLARERRRIKLSEIVRAIETLEQDSDPTCYARSHLGQTIIDPLCHDMQQKIMQALDKITVKDLLETQQQSAQNAAGFNFTI